MRIVTLWEPYASLVAMGVKVHETRSWAPPARAIGQDLIIHAAKRSDGNVLADCRCAREYLAAHPEAIAPDCPQPWPRLVATLGRCLCVVRLDGALPTGALAVWTDLLSPADREFGDFGPGRYGWRLGNLRRLPAFIPWKGQQGMSVAPSELVERIAGSCAVPADPPLPLFTRPS